MNATSESGTSGAGSRRALSRAGVVTGACLRRSRANHGRRHERGAALAEAAVALPLLLLAALAIVDLSRGIMVYNTLSHATREGTRYASVRSSKSDDPATVSKIATEVRTRAPNLIPEQLGVSVAWTPSNAPGAVVRVDGSYLFETVTPFIPVGAITITSRSQATITF